MFSLRQDFICRVPTKHGMKKTVSAHQSSFKPISVLPALFEKKLQQKFSFTPSLCEPAAQPSAIGGTNRKTLFFEAVVPSCFARDPQPGASSLVHGIDWMFQNLGSIHPIVFQWFWQSTSTVERTQHESAIFFGSNFQDRNTRVPKQWQTCIYSNPKSKPTREASQLPSEGQKEYLFPTACV